jgi:Protein of unknown function (DUF4031)
VTVYVDDASIQAAVTNPATGKTHRSRWCHLFADDRDELHHFAASIGLRRESFQDRPRTWHYAVTDPERRQAITAGARPVTWRNAVEIMQVRDGKRAATPDGKRQYGDLGKTTTTPGTWAATGTLVTEPYPCRCAHLGGCRYPHDQAKRSRAHCPDRDRQIADHLPPSCCARKPEPIGEQPWHPEQPITVETPAVGGSVHGPDCGYGEHPSCGPFVGLWCAAPDCANPHHRPRPVDRASD